MVALQLPRAVSMSIAARTACCPAPHPLKARVAGGPAAVRQRPAAQDGRRRGARQSCHHLQALPGATPLPHCLLLSADRPRLLELSCSSPAAINILAACILHWLLGMCLLHTVHVET